MNPVQPEPRLSFPRLRRPTAAELLLGVIIICLVGTLIALLIVRGNQVSENKKIIGQLSESALLACKRGNVARHHQLQFNETIISGNHRRAQAWKELTTFALPPSIAAAVHDEAAANRFEARNLTIYTNGYVTAQRSVSSAPHSKDIFKRAHVNCDKAAEKGK